MANDKVIYLDIDGVLNNNKTKNVVRLMNKWGEISEPHYGVSEDLISKLNAIIDNTGAFVWIHSSWRESYEASEIYDLFFDNGFNGVILGNIPFTKLSMNRGEDIAAHVERNNIEKYVIIDDLPESFFNTENHAHFIRTNSKIGLSDDDVARAIDILNS